MAVLTALALVFGAGRSAGHHPLGGRLGCVAGLPAGVEAARRAALCVFTAWISLRSCAASSRAAAAASRGSSRPPSSCARRYTGLSLFLACPLAFLDMLPQAPPKASSPQKDGKTRVAECDNPTLAYFLLRRKLLGNLPESVAFSSLACLGVESNP